MNLISVDKISKTIGDKELFKTISFGIDESDKVALIGTNGSGKSTLIRLLLGTEEPDSGQIYKNRNLKISSLKQNPVYNPEDTIKSHIFNSDSYVLKLIKKYEDVCEKLEHDDSPEKKDELTVIMSEMDKYSAWDYHSTIKSILNELGIKDLSLKMSELSGGMLKKVELVQILIDESNLLILDEPTNHLDIETILWLENFLINTDKAVLLVTHDRYFLETITDKIVEIDNKDFRVYQGNYDDYLEKKVELEEELSRKEEKAKAFLRVELEWLRRQPKARGTKQKARIDRASDVMNREKYVKADSLKLKVNPDKVGKKILELKNITKSYNEKVLLDKFTYTFKHYERLGIVGANGAGKSTLLNIITSKIDPDSGVVAPGINTKFGYFDQNSFDLKPEMRVLEYIQKTSGEYIKQEDGEKISASLMLERFFFPSRMQSTLIEKLSGGERRRLYLVQILMQNPNFLILDEPTNDFDIKTLSVLEEFLLEFPGCVLVVSHDRYFMDRIADHLLIFEGNGVLRGFPGTYSEYREKKKEEERAEDKKRKLIVETEEDKAPKDKKKIPFKIQKEIEAVEKDIENLESNLKLIHTELETSHSDFAKVKELSDRLKETEDLLNSRYLRWEELNQ